LPPKIELTGDEVTIGRDTPAEIVLAYPTVSGAHCQIAMVDRDFYIMDLSSTNGTFVNGATSISSTSTRPFAHPTNPKPYLTALALRDWRLRWRTGFGAGKQLTPAKPEKLFIGSEIVFG
jgi:pSer/pThr/pTyr-binding forkhead associated (FHA) protein